MPFLISIKLTNTTQDVAAVEANVFLSEIKENSRKSISCFEFPD